MNVLKMRDPTIAERESIHRYIQSISKTTNQFQEMLDNNNQNHKITGRLKLYCYSNPNQMDGYLQNGDCHKFTDDVALCYAVDEENAINIFSRLYNKELLTGHIKEVKFNNYGIFVATDY